MRRIVAGAREVAAPPSACLDCQLGSASPRAARPFLNRVAVNRGRQVGGDWPDGRQPLPDFVGHPPAIAGYRAGSLGGCRLRVAAARHGPFRPICRAFGGGGEGLGTGFDGDGHFGIPDGLHVSHQSRGPVRCPLARDRFGRDRNSLSGREARQLLRKLADCGGLGLSEFPSVAREAHLRADLVGWIGHEARPLLV